MKGAFGQPDSLQTFSRRKINKILMSEKEEAGELLAPAVLKVQRCLSGKPAFYSLNAFSSS